MIRKLITAPCAKCKKNIEFFVVQDFNNDLTLPNYSLFKSPDINMCPECGYINDNLAEDNILFQNKKISLSTDTDLFSNLFNDIKIARNYLNSIIDTDKKIRVLAFIFSRNKQIYNSFLKNNYTKKDENTISIIKTLSTNLKNSCCEILDYLEQNNIDNNFSNLLKIEVLSTINKTKDAKEIYKKLVNLSEDLQDYIEECIEMGGLV